MALLQNTGNTLKEVPIQFIKITHIIFAFTMWLRQQSICVQCRRPGFDPWDEKIPWRSKWQSTPVLLPGKSHGRRSLVGYSPWGRKEWDTAERPHFHFQVDKRSYFLFKGNNMSIAD